MDSVNGAEPTHANGSRPPDLPPPIGSPAPFELFTEGGLAGAYLQLTADLPSPHVFRLWAGLHAIGAAGERRVWTQFGSLRLHPNLFVFLVGPPGTGKTVALKPIGMLLRKSGSVTLAPNDITKQGLLDSLAEASRGAIMETPDGRRVPFDYHFLALHISELSNFMSQYDSALAGLLTDFFDCPDSNEEKKRGHDKGKLLVFPGISMIVGTATQNLGSTISPEMWGSGFMARVINVYSADDVVPLDRFADVPEDAALQERIVTGLRTIGGFRGPMSWTTEGRRLLNTFSQNQEDGAPLHNRLIHYVKRRWLHLGKLCMVAALSRQSMEVTAEDFHTALRWLTSAESNVTEIFKDMVSHEDGQVFEELRSTFFAIHMAASKAPITSAAIHKYLSQKVAAHQIPRMVEIACKADYFRMVAGTEGDDALYIPQSPNTGPNLGAI